MAFSKKYSRAASNGGESVEAHPILEKGSVSIAVKQYYLQGCVVAALMDADTISGQVRNRLERLGRSLKMSQDEIWECIEVVTGLDSGNGDWEAFTAEMLETLKSAKVGIPFLGDFEDVMAESHEISVESYQHLNRFGSELTGDKLWRLSILLEYATALSAKDGEEQPKRWFEKCRTAKQKNDSVASKCLQFAEMISGAGKNSVKPKSKKEAEWVQRFANSGNTNAMCLIGNVALAGNRDLGEVNQGFALLLKAAKAGNVNAQYKVGCSYHEGKGCKKDDVVAFKWFKKAADQGNMEAVNMVGVFYQKSLARDVWPVDEEHDAEACFKNAAEAGIANAQYNLAEIFDGRCYSDHKVFWFNGEPKFIFERNRISGWSDDKENALKWYRLAAAQGCIKAKKKVAEIEQEQVEASEEKSKEEMSKKRKMIKDRFMNCMMIAWLVAIVLGFVIFGFWWGLLILIVLMFVASMTFY